MKKSLIALALVGAFASAAQAAESNYTIYGRLDLGITKTNEEGKDSIKLNNGTQSRLGFKGTEELGNGLKAKFQIEHRFNADDGTNRETDADGVDRIWRGQAWLGLAGTFGEVRLGRQYDALANTSDQIDPFGSDYVLTAHSEGLSKAAPAGRRNNSVVYMTPDMGNGFSAQVNYTFAETNYKATGSVVAGETVRNTVGARFAYENGPLAVSLAMQNGGDSAFAKAEAAALVPGAALAADKMETALYAGYTFNSATTVGLGVYQSSLDSIVGGKDLKLTGYTLSATHKVGAGKVLAGYQWGKDNMDSTNDKYKKFAVGYHHGLSDRTTLYVNVASEKVTPSADNVSAFGFGVKHNF